MHIPSRLQRAPFQPLPVTGLSRNTIRKYLRSDGIEPQFKVLDRPSKLDPFADRLAAWLKTEANRPRKPTETMSQRL